MSDVALVAGHVTAANRDCMVDKVDRQTRSRIMARVKSKDTKPELALRRGLFHRGFRYRLHANGLPGRPDLFFPKYGAVVFINGCFWHWHGCSHSRFPSSNVEYWRAKIARNQARDKENYEELHRNGWRVLVVWECSLEKSVVEATITAVDAWLKGRESFSAI